MKSMLPIVTLAGLTSTASAGLSVHLSFSDTVVAIGGTVTATITASFTGGAGSYFSSATFDLVTDSSSFVVAGPMSLGWGMSALGESSGGVPDGAGLNSVFAAQHSLFGAVNTSNPFVIGWFSLICIDDGPLTYTVRASANAPGAFSYTDAAGGPFAPPIYAGAEAFTSDTVQWVPSPTTGTVLLAGMGFLTSRRRGPSSTP